MPLNITYLTVDFTIAGKKISLNSEEISALAGMFSKKEYQELQTNYKQKLDTFKEKKSVFQKAVDDISDPYNPSMEAISAQTQTLFANMDSEVAKATITLADQGVISEKIKQGLTFKMRPEDKIECTIRDIINWFKEITDPSLGQESINLPPAFEGMIGEGGPDALNGIKITIWDMWFNTRFEFGLNVKVSLTEEFYTGLNIPKAVTKIFTLDSLGVGLTYTRSAAEIEKAEERANIKEPNKEEE